MSGEQPGLYEQVLAAQGGALPPARPPRPSASVVPWRHTPDGLAVYWVERSRAVPFMPGWYAFPGGALHRDDAALHVDGLPAGLDAGSTEQPMRVEGEELPPDAVAGLAACALRELFEETGLLPLAGPAPSPADLAAARHEVLERPEALASWLARWGARLGASRLVFAGRWLTPPFAPVRFDNRFFLLEWPAGEPEPDVWPGELARGEWISPAAALDRWRDTDLLAAPPILHVLRVLSEVAADEALPRLRSPVEADLGPIRRIEFRPGVILLPLATPTLPPATHTNCYLLGTGDAVVVDPGSPLPAEQERLLAALRAAAEQGRRPTAIWLTHHHPDHVGGVEALRAALGLPVLAHSATAERLAARGIRCDGELADGQRVELGSGFPVRVLHTPGHARGHLAFLAEAHGSLLCGDLVSALSTIVIDPPEGDMATYLASIEAAAAAGPRTLFPAHGPVMAAAVAALRRAVAHRHEREEKILAAWRDDLRDTEAMLPRVYDDVPQHVWPLAARQIEAHLAHLRERGALG